MYSQDADAICICTLDGLGTYGVVPFIDKTVYIGGAVLTELHQLVEKSTDITALLC